MRNKNDNRKRSQVKQFFDAVNRRSEKEVTELLSQGVSPDATDYYGNFPLMLVTASSHGFSLGSLLIEAGASVNATNVFGETALFNASRAGNSCAVRLLLKHGADPNAASKSGFTALMAATANGHARIVQILLMHGADPSAKTRKGVTAIMIATERCAQEIVGLLAAHCPAAKVGLQTDTKTLVKIAC